MEEHFDQFERAIFLQENESAAASSAAPAPVPTASTSFAEVGLEMPMKKRSKRLLTQDMEGLRLYATIYHIYVSM